MGVPVKSAVLVEARALAVLATAKEAVAESSVRESLVVVALTKAVHAAPHARSSQEAFRAAPTKKRETHLFTRSPAPENKSQSHV